MNNNEEFSMFSKLWKLMCDRTWFDYEIYAITNKDFDMSVWSGIHPVESNTTKHICKKDSRVRVWMVSRFGDVGITDNLINPTGYNVRGLDADKDLYDYELILK
jgi:creatinine amidohydrolase/Fe(II)-dependent formamide hydrolase-like protein